MVTFKISKTVKTRSTMILYDQTRRERRGRNLGLDSAGLKGGCVWGRARKDTKMPLNLDLTALETNGALRKNRKSG